LTLAILLVNDVDDVNEIGLVSTFPRYASDSAPPLAAESQLEATNVAPENPLPLVNPS